MDRRHLSIERVAPPGHLAGRRSGLGHRSAGSKTPSPAPVVGKARKDERALETMARRCRPPVLASLFEQARPAHLGDFALAGRSALLTEVTNVTTAFKAYLSRADRRSPCRAIRRMGRRRGR